MKLKAKHKEIVKYWFLFLREHDGYKACCEAGGEGKHSRLFQDFGNIHEVEFDDWWPDHEELFVPLEPFNIEVIHRRDELHPSDFDDPHALFIEVNLLSSRTALMDAFKTLLTEQYPAPKGRPPMDDTGEYPLASRMTADSLKTALIVYQRVKAAGEGLANFAEIGRELKEKNILVRGTADKTGLYNEVSRHFQIAKRLIKNTATENDVACLWSQFPLDE